MFLIWTVSITKGKIQTTQSLRDKIYHWEENVKDRILWKKLNILQWCKYTHVLNIKPWSPHSDSLQPVSTTMSAFRQFEKELHQVYKYLSDCPSLQYQTTISRPYIFQVVLKVFFFFGNWKQLKSVLKTYFSDIQILSRRRKRKRFKNVIHIEVTNAS